jgi:benzoate membrane transport protein
MVKITIDTYLPNLDIAVRNIIIFITVLVIPLTAAQDLALTKNQTASWIAALYGIPGLLSLAAAVRYRQPILFTGNIFVIIFITSLGGSLSYPELIGATMTAGAVVLLLSIFGMVEKIAAWIPTPVIFGLLAGAVLPFVARLFTALGIEPVVIGSTFLVFILSRRMLGSRISPILPALVIGLVVAALTGKFGQAPTGPVLFVPVFTLPVFSIPALLTATPVIIILITLQANIPSLIFMQDQDFQPPERGVNIISGIGTALGSLFGPTGLSLSLPVTSLIAGNDAGEHPYRYRAVYLVAGAALVIGLLAGIAAGLTEWIPIVLLQALAGLALINVLLNALKEITRGPAFLGPLFAFAISLSDISLFGFGPFFWALILGSAITLLLERSQEDGK